MKTKTEAQSAKTKYILSAIGRSVMHTTFNRD